MAIESVIITKEPERKAGEQNSYEIDIASGYQLRVSALTIKQAIEQVEEWLYGKGLLVELQEITSISKMEPTVYRTYGGEAHR